MECTEASHAIMEQKKRLWLTQVGSMPLPLCGCVPAAP
jgi:hypothetical protein